MNAYSRLFLRLMIRPAWREPVRTALTILSVALGVAVVLAIDLAGQSAAGSFHASLEALTGSADAEISGTGGVDERVLGTLVQLPYAFTFTPRIQDFATVNGKGPAVPFIGADLVAHQTTLPDASAGSYPSGDAIWAGAATHLKPGQEIRLLINDSLQPFTVVGIIHKRAGDLAEANFLLTDIGVAQRVTGKVGRLDAILVQFPAGHDASYWQHLIQRALPAGATVAPKGARTQENRKMLAAFRWNLRILSYIALLVGAFLIYNTISVSVVRRRPEIGIIRALGATKPMIIVSFLAEAGFFAAVGGAVGLVLGRLMAIGAVRLVGSTVNTLYVTSQAAPLTLTLTAAVSAVGLGLAVAMAAAVLPANEAGRVQPAEAMARSRIEYHARTHAARNAVFGAAATVAAVLLCQLPPIHHQPWFGYCAVLALVGGFALSTPALVVAFSSIIDNLLSAVFGVEARLAMRSLRASLRRTAVLTSSLAVAIAMTASVAIMVGSFRQTVSVWMNNELKADLYLRPAGNSAADRHPTMDVAVADRIGAIPNVAFVDRYRAYPVVYDGSPATLAGGQTEAIARTDSARFLPGEDRNQIMRQLSSGDYAVVSEPFANKHDVHPGDLLELAIGERTAKLRIAGIYYDYSTEQGYITVDRRTLLKYLPDPALSNLAVYLKPGANEENVRAAVEQSLGAQAVLVFTNASLRKAAIEVFDRTFQITYAIEAVAIVVAVIGIAGALLALVIDRRRELALLQFLGASKRQITRLILFEAGLLGMLASSIGLILGACLSLILVYVINKQSFGWTIQFHWPVALLVAALSGIYVATVLAGLYPARKAVALRPIEVIHED